MPERTNTALYSSVRRIMAEGVYLRVCREEWINVRCVGFSVYGSLCRAFLVYGIMHAGQVTSGQFRKNRAKYGHTRSIH